MSVSPEQIAQAIKAIETQLAILKQAVGQGAAAEEGIVGIFDGEFMVQENGKRHQVPPNYASKTMLVPGDTVKMIEDPNGGQAKYKQITKAERAKTSGVLVKKDGKFEVLTEEGSFKVLTAAIKHYNGEVGDAAYIQYPKNHVKGSYAAVEKVVPQTESVEGSNVESTTKSAKATSNRSAENQQNQNQPEAKPNKPKTPTATPTASDPPTIVPMPEVAPLIPTESLSSDEDELV